MNRELIIHIGLPKTGTSSIQYFFKENRDSLKRHSKLLYPQLGEWVDGSHHGLAFALSHNPYQEVLSIEKQKTLLEELQNEIDNSQCDRVVLSSECFHLYNSEAFIEFSKNYKVTIICYIRELTSYFLSLYGQCILDNVFRETVSFEDFIIKEKNRGNYKELIRRWRILASPENIKIQIYNMQYLKGNDIIVDFLALLNIDSKEAYFKQLSKQQNNSVSYICLRFKRAVNKLPFDDGVIDRVLYLIKEWNAVNREKMIKNSFMTKNVQERIFKTFTHDILEIQEAYFDSSVNLVGEECVKEYEIADSKVIELYGYILRFIKSVDKLVFDKIRQSLFDVPNIENQETKNPSFYSKEMFLVKEAINSIK